MFAYKLNTGLAHKLVQIRNINERVIWRVQHDKVIEFERVRKIIEEIFGKKVDKTSIRKTRAEI